MEKVQLHLERLRRHYDVAVRSYDMVSLLDLSHALRIWAELRSELPKIATKFATTKAFKTATPIKKVLRRVRGTRFVLSYMPGGVITYANKSHFVSSHVPGEENSPITLAASVTNNPDGSVELGMYASIAAALEPPMIKLLDEKIQTRCNYAEWMGAEVVRTCYPTETGELKTVQISREMIVKRVANTMDGSHPSAAGAVNDGKNSFDPAIHHLLHYLMGGLPLPYFILLKIAQDILNIAPGLLDNRSSTFAI